MHDSLSAIDAVSDIIDELSTCKIRESFKESFRIFIATNLMAIKVVLIKKDNMPCLSYCPLFISLAHELIHVLRTMSGKYHANIPLTLLPIIKITYTSMEELYTIKRDRNYKFNIIDITENDLSMELNYNVRLTHAGILITPNQMQKILEELENNKLPENILSQLKKFLVRAVLELDKFNFDNDSINKMLNDKEFIPESIYNEYVDILKENAQKNSYEDDRDSRWYTDHEINTLMPHYLQNYANDVIVLTSMLGTDWLENNSLQNQITQFNQRRIQCLIQKELVQDKILIPVNLSNYHWVLVCIYYTERDNPDIYYLDPVGEDVNSEVEKAIQNVFPDVKIISQPGFLLQEDSYNCGPWIIEIARQFVAQGHLPDPGTIDIKHARRQHLEDLQLISILDAQPEAGPSNPIAKPT